MTTIELPMAAQDSASARVADARASLARARAHTLAIIAPLTDTDVATQHDPLMSPILWDLGHIAAFEELWLHQNVSGPILFAEMPGTYNPFEHPRASRGALPLPTLDGQREALARVRAGTQRILADAVFDARSPLLRNAYVVNMVAQHEWQHQETILQTLQLKQGAPYPASPAWALPRGSAPAVEGAMVRCDGARVRVGTDDRTTSYDNERPAHHVTLEPFFIDVTPVTNAAYRLFVENGGYDERSHWSEPGWAWAEREARRTPRHVDQMRHGVLRRRFGQLTRVANAEPAVHVSAWEAEAWCRWAGRRLPSEVEWEAAAHQGATRGFRFGDVWEWTASTFRPYPGFVSGPWREYSAPCFGGTRVLRGASIATSRGLRSARFRKFADPGRDDGFFGFRSCAA